MTNKQNTNTDNKLKSEHHRIKYITSKYDFCFIYSNWWFFWFANFRIDFKGFVQPPQPNDPYSGGIQDPEVKGMEFNDASIRRGFIRKVYAILLVISNYFTCFYKIIKITNLFFFTLLGSIKCFGWIYFIVHFSRGYKELS